MAVPSGTCATMRVSTRRIGGGVFAGPCGHGITIDHARAQGSRGAAGSTRIVIADANASAVARRERRGGRAFEHRRAPAPRLSRRSAARSPWLRAARAAGLRSAKAARRHRASCRSVRGRCARRAGGRERRRSFACALFDGFAHRAVARDREHGAGTFGDTRERIDQAERIFLLRQSHRRAENDRVVRDRRNPTRQRRQSADRKRCVSMPFSISCDSLRIDAGGGEDRQHPLRDHADASNRFISSEFQALVDAQLRWWSAKWPCEVATIGSVAESAREPGVGRALVVVYVQDRVALRGAACRAANAAS